MASQVAPNLESLGDAYQFLGELRGRRTTRSYLAKRRADGTDALVTIVSRPEGDERNALSHLAADTKLLVDHKHRNLIRILDGQWVGDDFAVISARVAAPTLRELLDRGEVLSTPRVAVILREVNGVLAWAREQKVVHRTVTPDTLYLDPRTDRVLVSFTIRPIRVLGRGDTVEEDARTIGRLAWAMLARTSVPPEESEQTLADLRPDLPLRVIEATQTLATHEGDGSPLPKVLDYVAAVAMAETLMLGELETAHVQAVMMDEQREQRLAWETEQRACENEIRDQAKRLAEEKAELEKAIAAER
ncbi:MAG TPA: hypothetical protein VEA99_14440, partial [Gemmatimonadaceae bacterium]|nr:hypothetical protein [Gemmatimonadaceae bacterium]